MKEIFQFSILNSKWSSFQTTIISESIINNQPCWCNNLKEKRKKKRGIGGVSSSKPWESINRFRCKINQLLYNEWSRLLEIWRKFQNHEGLSTGVNFATWMKLIRLSIKQREILRLRVISTKIYCRIMNHEMFVQCMQSGTLFSAMNNSEPL